MTVKVAAEYAVASSQTEQGVVDAGLGPRSAVIQGPLPRRIYCTHCTNGSNVDFTHDTEFQSDALFVHAYKTVQSPLL